MKNVGVKWGNDNVEMWVRYFSLLKLLSWKESR
jgi:hypothetical protein